MGLYLSWSAAASPVKPPATNVAVIKYRDISVGTKIGSGDLL
jgi:hypothetical protein